MPRPASTSPSSCSMPCRAGLGRIRRAARAVVAMLAWTPSVRNDSAVGWDIGGAHLKAAVVDANHHVSSIQQLACPLWKGLDRVREAVGEVMDQLPACAVHAVTMTGELADIFETRAQGVS